MKRVVITSVYALTPQGVLTEKGFSKSVGPTPNKITRFPVSDFPIQFGAEILAHDQLGLGMKTVAQAFHDQKKAILQCHAPEKIGVFVGAEPERASLEELALLQNGFLSVPSRNNFSNRYERRSPSCLTDKIAETYRALGPRRTFSMACAASAVALSYGYRSILEGKSTLAIVCGAALNVEPMLFAGFCLLGAMSRTGQSRPFDQNRDGFLLADGAGTILLEEEETVLKSGRNSSILGRILGAGDSLDAYRITDPDPEGRGAKSAITKALTDANVAASEIALVKAHATGTRKNDQVEAKVIDEIFGKKPLVLAVKGALGHSIGASGVVETIAALFALRKNFIENTVQLNQFDTDLHSIRVPCRQNSALSRRFYKIPGKIALCNTFGFGGINSSLVISLPDIKLRS